MAKFFDNNKNAIVSDLSKRMFVLKRTKLSEAIVSPEANKKMVKMGDKFNAS